MGTGGLSLSCGTKVQLQMELPQITIKPNHGKCETVRSSMVFMIGFLFFSAQKGSSLALRYRPQQNRGKSVISTEADFCLCSSPFQVWCASSGKCLRTLVGHTGGVWSSQMEGDTVVSGSTDRTLKVWDSESGQCVHTLYGHTSTVRCMHLHKNK